MLLQLLLPENKIRSTRKKWIYLLFIMAKRRKSHGVPFKTIFSAALLSCLMAVPGPSAMPAWAGTVFDKHLQVGKEYLLAAKFEMALKEFDAALRISPGDANALVERGTAYNGLGKYDLAI